MTTRTAKRDIDADEDEFCRLERNLVTVEKSKWNKENETI
jgi:hypothetical protein